MVDGSLTNRRGDRSGYSPDSAKICVARASA